jgi:hypothetical protein
MSFAPPAYNIQVYPQMSATLPQNNPSAFRRRRASFVLFLDTLLHYLDGATSREVCSTAKDIIRICVQQNRLGDPDFSNLMKTILVRLRQFVGEVHWERANKLFKVYMEEMRAQHAAKKRTQMKQANKYTSSMCMTSPNMTAMTNQVQQFEMFDDTNTRNSLNFFI